MDGISVVLQQNGKRIGSFNASAARFVFQFQAIVNQDTIVADGDSRLGDALAISRKFGCIKTDVVGLPAQGREGHVEIRGFEFVKRAAVIELQLQPKGIQHLYFVAFLQIEPAVTARLSTCQRHVRGTKLAVQREILIGLFGLTTDFEQAVRRHFRIRQSICIHAIKQHDGIRRWLGAKSRTQSLDGL